MHTSIMNHCFASNSTRDLCLPCFECAPLKHHRSLEGLKPSTQNKSGISLRSPTPSTHLHRVSDSGLPFFSHLKRGKSMNQISQAVGQNQWHHFGVGAPPILVYFSGDWDVHCGVLDFDPWPHESFGRGYPRCFDAPRSRPRLFCTEASEERGGVGGGGGLKLPAGWSLTGHGQPRQAGFRFLTTD